MSQGKNGRPTQLRLIVRKGQPCYGKVAHTPTRRLVLIDIENYCGKGVLIPEDIRDARKSICRELELRDEDLVVIGTSHGNNCLVCGSEWVGPRQVLRHGHDGADIALIDASREYRLETFSSVVIVSGDGIFSAVASAARISRRSVTVALGRGRLSNRLRFAASDVKHIQPDMKPAA